MTVFILPSLNRDLGELSYDIDKDEMWVYADDKPRSYMWENFSNTLEEGYLRACLAANIWLRSFDSPIDILEELINSHIS